MYIIIIAKGYAKLGLSQYSHPSIIDQIKILCLSLGWCIPSRYLGLTNYIMDSYSLPFSQRKTNEETKRKMKFVHEKTN